ncbi:MAG: hypothetical protein Kow00122_11560 [Thermoleophilia bacterium]
MVPAIRAAPTTSALPLMGTLPVVILALIPVALGVVHGGYFPTTWMALGMFVAAFVVVLRVAAGPSLPGFRSEAPARSTLSLVLLGLFAAWTLVSTVWATDKAAALQEGTRTVLYLLLYTLTALLVAGPRPARLLATIYVLASGAVALAILGLVATAKTPQEYFNSFRLDEPLGYYNAQATFFLMPAVLGLHLASRTAIKPTLRPALFAAAVASLQAAVLTQSRGGFWAFVATTVVYFLLVPDRPRSLLWWGTGLAIVILSFRYLNAPYVDLRHEQPEHLATSVRLLGRVVLASFTGGLTISTALVFTDLRLPRRPWIARAGTTAAVAVTVVGLILLFVRFPALRHPVESANVAWARFKTSETVPSDVRILDMSGSYRYQLWQVAWHSFTDKPLLGVGADNYVWEWRRLRPIRHDVLQPHNLYLRLLAETGIPGLVLLVAGVLLIMVRGSSQVIRRLPQTSLNAGLVAASTLFLVHAAAEWVWHVPATATAFFILLGTLSGMTDEYAQRTSPRRGSTRLTLAAAMSILYLVLAAPQTVSRHEVERAATLLARGDTAGARIAAGYARLTNPFDSQPVVVIAESWAREGKAGKAAEAFSHALARNPADWRVYLLWGDLVHETGGDPTGLLLAARALNPLSDAVAARLDALGRKGRE